MSRHVTYFSDHSLNLGPPVVPNLRIFRVVPLDKSTYQIIKWRVHFLYWLIAAR